MNWPMPSPTTIWRASREELGDLLLHVVFYSKLGEEAGAFDYADVANALCDKLVYRHPHVYGDIHANTPDQVKGELGSAQAPQKESQERYAGGVPPRCRRWSRHSA